MAVMNGVYQRFPVVNMGNRDTAGVEQNKVQGTRGVSGMVNNNAQQQYQQYQQNMVNTATPQELTLMLYNGLVKFLKLSIQGVDEKNIEKTSNNIIRAQDIITEFMCTLDMQYEISKSLWSLYDYMNRRLIDANLKKDRAIIEEVLRFAEELRDTWEQAMKLAKQVVNK